MTAQYQLSLNSPPRFTYAKDRKKQAYLTARTASPMPSLPNFVKISFEFVLFRFGSRTVMVSNAGCSERVTAAEGMEEETKWDE